MTILYFILGALFGSFLIITIKKMINLRQDYVTYYKGLNRFISLPINKYKFVSRTNHFVKITQDDYIFYIDLTKKELNIFQDDDLIIYKNNTNGQKLTHLYERLNSGFDYEIYNNITIINNTIISNNIVNFDLDNIDSDDIETIISKPSLDEVLEKINKYGVDNLSPTDLDILKNGG